MNNFLYQPDEQPKKYTMDDLNDAIGEDAKESENGGLGGGVWGSVANAAKTGNTSEMQ